jgi:hypothetical protein
MTCMLCLRARVLVGLRPRGSKGWLLGLWHCRICGRFRCATKVVLSLLCCLWCAVFAAKARVGTASPTVCFLSCLVHSTMLGAMSCPCPSVVGLGCCTNQLVPVSHLARQHARLLCSAAWLGSNRSHPVHHALLLTVSHIVYCLLAGFGLKLATIPPHWCHGGPWICHCVLVWGACVPRRRKRLGNLIHAWELHACLETPST